MLRLITFILNLAIIISCRAPSAFSKEEQQSVVDSVSRTLHDYYDEISKNGLLAEFRYLDSSDNFFWVPPGFAHALSFDSAAFYIRRNASTMQPTRITWETLRIIPLTRELATYTGKLNAVSIDTAGNTNKVSLIETGLVIKRSSGWKLLSGQTAVVN